MFTLCKALCESIYIHYLIQSSLQTCYLGMIGIPVLVKLRAGKC